MRAPTDDGTPDLESLPDMIRCSRQGCTEIHAGRRGVTDALAAGWVMIAGRWFCPADAERGSQRVIDDMKSLDDICQSEPEDLPEIDLGGEG